jgi:uracil-DNA glycosylase
MQQTGIRSEIQPEIKPEINLEPSWLRVLADEFQQPYMRELKSFLQSEIKSGKTIYPKPSEYFNAFAQTPFEKVKVVILGQDPYHGPGQAHGLSFSVKPGVRPPPSLKNIYKELKTDLGVTAPDHGYLVPWAKQGVLLLNAVLSVEEGKPGSHQKKGWENFTDKAVRALNDGRENLVFILWGAYAIKKAAFVDRKKHLVLQGVHPSPLSCSRGFFGSCPFSQANKYLKQHGIEPIDWQLPLLKDLLSEEK